jgi:hypothetical protein
LILLQTSSNQETHNKIGNFFTRQNNKKINPLQGSKEFFHTGKSAKDTRVVHFESLDNNNNNNNIKKHTKIYQHV